MLRHSQKIETSGSNLHGSSRRLLIVNADDFGMSDGVNRGILTAHRAGIVTSASLMVRWPAAPAAVARCREHSRLSLGLHVDLGEWACRGDEWTCLYEVTPLEDRAAVADEVAHQLDAFRRLTGQDPTHLDSHQHVHRQEPVRSVLLDWAERLSIPLRHFSPRVQHCGAYYGQTRNGEAYSEGISSAALLRLLADLPPGLTELGCHPGLDEDGAACETMYRHERMVEVATLCDPRVREALTAHGIELCSFEHLRQHRLLVGALP